MLLSCRVAIVDYAAAVGGATTTPSNLRGLRVLYHVVLGDERLHTKKVSVHEVLETFEAYTWGGET